MDLEISLGKIPFQQECTEVRKGIDVITIADIPTGGFHGGINRIHKI